MKCLFLLLSVFVIESLQTYVPQAKITVVSETDNNDVPERNGIRTTFGHCLHQKEVLNCLKHQAVNVLDKALKSNDQWEINDHMSLNRNPSYNDLETIGDNGRSFEDVIVNKMKNLFESRVFQFKFMSADNVATDINEARKKKDKHGGMMMMSGVAVMAMLAQMFLGKVAFLAGAALIIAKVALLFATLSGLKSKSGGGGSGGSEHVVYSDLGKQGWQRSIQTMAPVMSAHQHQQSPHSEADEMAYRGQQAIQHMPSYDGV